MDLSISLADFFSDTTLISQISKYAEIKTYAPKDCFFYEGHTHNYSTFLLKGTLKLFIEQQQKKILLYHLTSNNVCIVSLTNLFSEYPIDFSSEAMDHCTLLSIPLHKMTEWSSQYKEFRDIIITSHQRHYNSMLNVVQMFTEEPLERRLLSYLKLESIHQDSLDIKISHQQISDELNCSREAISRTIKKLEQSNKLTRKVRSISLTSSSF